RLELKKTLLVPLLKAVVGNFRSVAAERQITIETDLPEDFPPLNLDPTRIRQVVNNLLANSLKFTPPSGSVLGSLSSDDGSPTIPVSDTGIGIEPNYLPHLFTAFSQGESSISRSYGGLGLGLAISRQLIELHGGSIAAESPGRNQGSTFIVRLPV